jgi:hypothetical protein
MIGSYRLPPNKQLKGGQFGKKKPCRCTDGEEKSLRRAINGFSRNQDRLNSTMQ